MSIHPKLAFAITAVGLVTCVGCQSLTSSTATGATTTGGSQAPRQATGTPEIEVVKNGVLPDFNTTTVGKAFEGTFQNPTWTSFETAKGALAVQFDGTVTVGALKKGKVQFGGTTLSQRISDTCVNKFRPAQGKDFSKEDLEKAMSCIDDTQVPVRFQFLFSSDKTSFQVGYVDQQVFGGHVEQALDFIYR